MITTEQLDELKSLVTDLRKKQDAASEGVMTRTDFEAYKAKMDADVNALLDRANDFETKMNRPQIEKATIQVDEKGRAIGLINPADAPEGMFSEEKAFNKWLRGRATPEEMKALATDDDTTGGYSTSPQIRNQILRQVVLLSPLRDIASRETISGNALIIPSETIGGFSSGWVGERDTRSETTNDTLGEIRIDLHEMYAKPRATQTMLDDSAMNVESWIGLRIAESFALREGTAFLTGSGAGQPEGILTNASVLAAYVKSGAAATLTTDGVRTLEYTLKAPYARNATFMMKRSTVLSLMLLKDGDGRYLWQPSLTGGVASTFDGYPIVENEDMDAPGAGKYSVLFGDFRTGYQIVDKATIAMLRDPYSAKPYVEFYTTRRVGGRVVMPEAIKVLKCEA